MKECRVNILGTIYSITLNKKIFEELEIND